MSRLICLFGGTFDPVHYGHLQPLQELQKQLDADAVHVIPAALPPHRPSPHASSQQRVNMLELALREYPGFFLDTRELERSGPSWTVLTLRSFRQQYPDDSLCLVMGSDAFADLPTWYHWQEILQLAHVVVIERAGMEVVSRPGWASDYLEDNVASLRKRKSSKVFYVSLKGVEISSTEIRKRLATGQDVRGMLPDEVISYIRQNKLYQT
jgi:nicotinate-nucleotide adenylyltransferase